MTDRKEERIT